MKKHAINTIKIEKGIPIPPKSKFPFKDMEIGDSFVTDNKNVRSYAYFFARFHPGFKFLVHKIDGTETLRCHRIPVPE